MGRFPWREIRGDVNRPWAGGYKMDAFWSTPPATAACSLHIRVRAFAAFGDETVDPRRDNRQRH
jgi:hypothetical protein